MQLPAVENHRAPQEAHRDRRRRFIRAFETLTSCTFSEILLMTFLTTLTAALIVWFLFHCPTFQIVANGAQKVPNSRSTLDSILLIAERNRSLTTSFHLNSWYRYATFLAKEKNVSNCYVCTRMPVACRNPHIIPSPFYATDLFPDILGSGLSPRFLNQTVRGKTGQSVPTLLPNVGRNFSKFLAVNSTANDPLYGPVVVPPNTQFVCYANDLTLQEPGVQIGSVPKAYCSHIYAPCTAHPNGTLNSTQAPQGATCKPYFTVPDTLGTMPQSDFVWMCGANVFLSLPPNWLGRCAVVVPTDHSFIISTQDTAINKRRKRGLSTKHDSVWATNVPKDHKLWTDGQKVLLSLFPWLGVGKVMLQMETLDYRFGSFANITIAALKDVKQELRALRMMDLQDRMVLDQLTASQGGVCVIIGTSCCTFIPANEEDAGVISQAIATLTALRDASLHGPVPGGGIDEWLTARAWWQILKFLTPVLAIFILFCVFAICVLRCINMLIQRMISNVSGTDALVSAERSSVKTTTSPEIL